MRISDSGLRLIAGFEGFVGRLYNDPAGHCTIGYGHLLHLGACGNGCDEELPYANGITEAEGLVLLRVDARRFVSCVSHLVTVPLTQNQFDALVSFAFNVGCGGFGSSTLLGMLNEGNYGAVCARLRRWVYGYGSREVLPGLVRRREAECELFEREDTPPVEEDEDMGELGEKVEALAAAQLAAGLFLEVETKLAINVAVPPVIRNSVRWMLRGAEPNKQTSGSLLRVLYRYAAGRALEGRLIDDDTIQRLRYAVRED